MKNPCPTCSTYFRGNKLPLWRYTESSFRAFFARKPVYRFMRANVAIRNVLPAGVCNFMAINDATDLGYIFLPFILSPVFFFLSFFFLSPAYTRYPPPFHKAISFLVDAFMFACNTLTFSATISFLLLVSRTNRSTISVFLCLVMPGLGITRSR